jgi:RNA polymerase sigma-70 factor, ECF subfamily
MPGRVRKGPAALPGAGEKGGVILQTCRHIETTQSAPYDREGRDHLTRFVDEHLRRTFLQIYRIVGNPADAQDLTQEAFIKAWQRGRQLRDGRKAEAWLGAIAHNVAIDFLRRRGPFIIPQDDTVERSHDDNPEQLLLRAEKRSRLCAGLRCLTEREQKALILRDVEGVETEEVARILGCSKATVRCHIANAREKYRRYLNQEDLRQRGRVHSGVL